VIVIKLGIHAMDASTPFAATLWSIPSLGTIVLRADAMSGLFLLVSGLVFFPVSIFAANALPRLLGRYNVRAYAVMYLALFCIRRVDPGFRRRLFVPGRMGGHVRPLLSARER
jgi:formate hydrogenlyase subunit 3/multisubunit Na+/H+ antiporter MnhD subunit